MMAEEKRQLAIFKEFMQQMYGAEVRELTLEEKEHLHKLMEERTEKRLNGQTEA